MLPLTGITVLSLEQAVAAPLASRHLADLGARVIKIERPGVGDFARGYDRTVHGQSSYFVWLNRSKESLSLDVKQPEAAAILAKLLAKSDVFIQNLAPGAAERLGLGSAELRARDPRLITCTISGYGSSGPYRDQKAYDLLIQAETGVIALTGTEEEPAKVGISVADIAAGMYAYSGILTALYTRERTGEGAALETSLLDALGEWASAFALYADYGGKAPVRSGAYHAIIAPYGPYATGDGRSVYLAVQNEREWARFCGEVLQHPEIANDPRFSGNPQRVEHREALKAAIETAFEPLTAEEAGRRLNAADIAYAQLRGIGELAHHPQHEARGRFQELGTPNGPVWTLPPPLEMAGVEYAPAPVPSVGEHSAAILDELGYDAEAVARLRAEGTI